MKSQNIFQSYKVTDLLILTLLVQKLPLQSNNVRHIFHSSQAPRGGCDSLRLVVYTSVSLRRDLIWVILELKTFQNFSFPTKMALALSFLQPPLPSVKDWELPLIFYVSRYQADFIQRNFLLNGLINLGIIVCYLLLPNIYSELYISSRWLDEMHIKK